MPCWACSLIVVVVLFVLWRVMRSFFYCIYVVARNSQRVMIEGGTSGSSSCVIDIEIAVDPETSSLMVTVFTSHWMINHTGLDLIFGQQYVPPRCHTTRLQVYRHLLSFAML